MGWSVGAGLAILLLLALSVVASVLTLLRFVTRSERTHSACIIAPALAACLGFGVAALLRLATLSTFAFDILAIGAFLGVGFGCIMGCLPLQS